MVCLVAINAFDVSISSASLNNGILSYSSDPSPRHHSRRARSQAQNYLSRSLQRLRHAGCVHNVLKRRGMRLTAPHCVKAGLRVADAIPEQEGATGRNWNAEAEFAGRTSADDAGYAKDTFSNSENALNPSAEANKRPVLLKPLPQLYSRRCARVVSNWLDVRSSRDIPTDKEPLHFTAEGVEFTNGDEPGVKLRAKKKR